MSYKTKIGHETQRNAKVGVDLGGVRIRVLINIIKTHFVQGLIKEWKYIKCFFIALITTNCLQVICYYLREKTGREGRYFCVSFINKKCFIPSKLWTLRDARLMNGDNCHFSMLQNYYRHEFTDLKCGEPREAAGVGKAWGRFPQGIEARRWLSLKHWHNRR